MLDVEYWSPFLVLTKCQVLCLRRSTTCKNTMWFSLNRILVILLNNGTTKYRLPCLVFVQVYDQMMAMVQKGCQRLTSSCQWVSPDASTSMGLRWNCELYQTQHIDSNSVTWRQLSYSTLGIFNPTSMFKSSTHHLGHNNSGPPVTCPQYHPITHKPSFKCRLASSRR